MCLEKILCSTEAKVFLFKDEDIPSSSSQKKTFQAWDPLCCRRWKSMNVREAQLKIVVLTRRDLEPVPYYLLTLIFQFKNKK